MATPVQIAVNGLAGLRCTLEASTEWTILQVHEAIEGQIRIPVDWQTLVKDTEKLAWEVPVASLISDKPSETLQLTLLVEEAPEPDPGALWAAIRGRDEATALQVLGKRQLPGLNNVDPAGGGWTTLHLAIDHNLPEVALAIVARPDYTCINLKTPWDGYTVLHSAAQRGYLPLCQAILGRADFCELLAVSNSWKTAWELARSIGEDAVAEFLGEAEADAQT